MAIDPISSISNNTSGIDPAQASAMNNNQITAMLTSGKIDPKFATMLLNQMASNNVNSILFGNESSDGTSGTSDNDIFGMQNLVPNNLQGASSKTGNIFGESSFGNVSPQFQMSVYSSLIGKTVTATDPATRKEIVGEVRSALLQGGKVVLNINGTIVPTENIVQIQK